MTDEIDHERLREENLIDNYRIATGVGVFRKSLW